MGSLHHGTAAGTPSTSNSLDEISTGIDKNLMTFELYKAAQKGSVESFKLALQKFSLEKNIPESTIFDQSSPLKNTLLHVAACFGNTNLVHYLLDKFPAFLNRPNYKRDTPLHVAARAGYLDVTRILVNKSIDRDRDLERNDGGNILLLANEEGNTPLHEAIIHDHEKVVDYFLASRLGDDACFMINNEEKSPLYLAVEAWNVKIAMSILSIGCGMDRRDFHDKLTKGKSVVHAAISGKNLVLLQEISKANRALVYVKDKKQQNSLHCAASSGFLEGVNYILNEFEMDTFAKDLDGLCPIHLASRNGHVDVIQKLLQYYPDAREFLNRKGQNILHIAAENGRDNVVRYLLKRPGAELLLNERDYYGNTSLHLATRNWHPKVVSSLTWDKRVNLKIVNNDGLTALEVSETYMEVMAPFRKRLTWMALMSAGAVRAKLQDAATVNRLNAAKYEPYNMEYCKDRVNTLLLVSTLVATVTFAAGFTMPGGNNPSQKSLGMALMLHKLNFQIFIICNSIAMYSSIIVAVTLMWAQLGDLNLLLNALRSAQRLLGLSLTMMATAFMVGVHLVVTKLPWLGIVVLIMGILSVVSLLALFVPLFLPYTSNSRIARCISYYPFYLLMMASESYA